MIRTALKAGLKKVISRVTEGGEGQQAAPPTPAARSTGPVDAAPLPPVATPTEPVAAPVEPVAAPVAAAPAPTPEPEAPQASPVVDSDDTAGPPLSLEEVQEVLDEMVRPALQGDGGDIKLIKIQDNNIYVKLVGSCSSCPSSIMTMKMGVEALLKEEFPAMNELIQVD